MDRKEFESKYNVELEMAPITGGADIQPHDWLKEIVCDELHQGSSCGPFITMKGSIYRIEWDEGTQSLTHIEKVYGKTNKTQYIKNTINKLTSGVYGVPEFYYSYDICEMFEDNSVDYWFILGGCLWVVDIFESYENLHNNASVRCVWKQDKSINPKDVHSKIIECLEDGNEDIIIAYFCCGSVVTAHPNGNDIDFEFWYAKND